MAKRPFVSLFLCGISHIFKKREYIKIERFLKGEIMRTHRSKKSSKLTRLFFIFILFIGLILFIDHQIRPVVKTVASYEGKRLATDIISRSVRDVLSQAGDEYDNLVFVSYDWSGNISSVKTDVTAINRLQSQISLAVNEKIEDIRHDTIKIPLGTFSGLSYLNGQGPSIKFQLQPVGYVKTQLASTFIESGINQTLHQIVLNVDADAMAVIPGHNTGFTVTGTYILAETVVVGKVPDGYTYVTGDSRDSLTKVNDYLSE